MNKGLFHRLAKGAIRLANWLVDGLVLSIIVLIVCYTGYTLIDNNRVANQAGTEVFESYKPAGDDFSSFDQLQRQNPDVFAWLTVYGTGIDYPVVQGKDNEQYLNTNALGEFALSGALFVDYRNAPQFAGPSTIIYGHHMEGSLMFGDLDQYGNGDYFRQHRYGDVFYQGQHHGVEVCAYVQADASDQVLYSTEVGTSPTVQEFIDYVKEHAGQWREGLSATDHMLVLSTCSSGTNERHIVVARITDQTYDNPYAQDTPSLADTANQGIPMWAKVAIGILAFIAIAWLVGAPRKQRSKRKRL